MGIKDIFKEILAETMLDQNSSKQESFEFIERDVKIHWIPRKATIVKGVRRAGKSLLLQNRVLSTAHSDAVISIPFVDERLIGLKAEDLGELLSAYEELQDISLMDKKVWFLFDEIQVVHGWEFFVERLLRKPNVCVSITGSSSKLLSKEIATEMRGRSLQQEVYPFSLKEFLRAKKVSIDSSTASAKVKQKKWFLQFLIQGGFPEVLHLENQQRKLILQEYFETIIFRDVVERSRLYPVEAVRRLALELMNQHASLITINKTFEKLKSLGYKIQKNFVSDTLTALEDCYGIFQVPVFSESVARQNTNPKKIYCVDSGMVTALRAGFSENLGRLLEGAVFIELRRRGRKIWYYKSEIEVDFITEDDDGHLDLYQVALHVDTNETLQREIRALEKAMKELNLKKGFLIVANNVNKIIAPKSIEVLSAWDFCLNLRNEPK